MKKMWMAPLNWTLSIETVDREDNLLCVGRRGVSSPVEKCAVGQTGRASRFHGYPITTPFSRYLPAKRLSNHIFMILHYFSEPFYTISFLHHWVFLTSLSLCSTTSAEVDQTHFGAGYAIMRKKWITKIMIPSRWDKIVLGGRVSLSWL